MAELKRVALGLITAICVLGIIAVPAAAEPPDAYAAAETIEIQSTTDTITADAVGTGSCVGTDACVQNGGDVGDSSCNGLKACFQNDDDIGNSSCNGETACMQQGAFDPDDPFGICPVDFPCATVGNNSCNGFQACFQNGATVGDNSCNGAGICIQKSGVIGDCQFNSMEVAACDETRPEVLFNTTTSVDKNELTKAYFSCSDAGGSGLVSCTGTLDGKIIANAAPIDTSTPGRFILTVTAIDGQSNTTVDFITITVNEDRRVLLGQYAGNSGSRGAIARLYMAVFGRQPDDEGHVYWVTQNGVSVSMWDIARLFVASEEFVLTYDSLNDEAFLDLLYLNVIGRPADDEGAAYWLALMQGGLDRGGVTLQFSESQEFKNVTKTS